MKPLRTFFVDLAHGGINIAAVSLMVTCCRLPEWVQLAWVLNHIGAEHHYPASFRKLLYIHFPLLLGVPAAPAYIADNEAGMRVWRYVVPEGGPTAAGPPGYGDGEYRPVADPQTVVAVVGSAHVRGIVREWERIEDQSKCLQRLSELLGENE